LRGQAALLLAPASAKGAAFRAVPGFFLNLKAAPMAKISGVDIRPGNILEYEKGIWKVAKTQHTQPARAAPSCRSR
jgi:hypothetical protein